MEAGRGSGGGDGRYVEYFWGRFMDELLVFEGGMTDGTGESATASREVVVRVWAVPVGKRGGIVAGRRALLLARRDVHLAFQVVMIDEDLKLLEARERTVARILEV
jgi:hypothetical protein